MLNQFVERVAALVTALLIALGVVVLTPAVASAEVDNCTAVPDAGSTFDFTAACAAHDRCYEDRPYGNSDRARKQCDRDLREAMLGWCRENWSRSEWQERATCEGVAWLYYYGVRWFGGLGWDRGGDADLAA